MPSCVSFRAWINNKRFSDLRMLHLSLNTLKSSSETLVTAKSSAFEILDWKGTSVFNLTLTKAR